MAQRTVNHAVLTLALLTSVAAQMGVMMPSMGYMGFGGSMFGPGMSGGNQAGTTYKGGVNTENPNAVFSPPGKKLIKRVDVSAFLWLLLLLSFSCIRCYSTYNGGVNTENPTALFSPPGKS